LLYDLIIIGGGPAGYIAAERAGHAGMKTLLIEKKFIGGVCLNEGCIPSKTLLNSAKIYDYARHGEKYGVTTEGAALDHGAVVKRKNKVVKMLVSGITAALKKNGVTVLEAAGVITGRNTEGFNVEAGGETHTGKRLLIATGSNSIIPPIPGAKEGLEKGFVLTNREILDLTEIPNSLAVVGGGVIGLEMASYFNSAGSKVTVIEMLDHIAGNTDIEISKLLMNNYIKKGIDFHLSAKVTEITGDSVVFEKDGAKVNLVCDKVLMSVGRRPATEGLGLESINVETERGHIKTDLTGRTNIPGVYAAGDVNGVYMLAHAAYREAEVCVNNMLGKRDRVRYDSIPAVTYTNPEVGSVGETEESAAAKGIECKVSSISMRYSGRYVAENEGGDGICKVIADKKTNRIIGVHMIGSYPSEIIFGAGMMIEMEMRIEDIKELVFPHPTVSEIIREAVFAFE